MLSERERRILARIDRHLTESDPDLARLFAGATAHPDTTTPTFLLVVGLALVVFGSLAAALPVSLAGVVLSVFALIAAYARPAGLGRPTVA